MWVKWTAFEILLVVNMALFLLFLTVSVTVAADIIVKRLTVGLVFFWSNYFDAKKNFLQELSKLDIPDERKSAFN